MKQHLQKQQSENMTDLKEMDSLIDWNQQEKLHEQAQYLRARYEELKKLLEKTPGEIARGTLLLACNVLMQGAETIEEHYADRLGDKNAR